MWCGQCRLNHSSMQEDRIAHNNSIYRCFDRFAHANRLKMRHLISAKKKSHIMNKFQRSHIILIEPILRLRIEKW